MIDIENDVIDKVGKAVREAHPGIWFAGEYVPTPAKFPAAMIHEADNHVFQRMRSSSGIENAVQVMFEARVFSDRNANKKSEAKAIMKTIDSTMLELGFTRTFVDQIPNLYETRIFQILARYEAIVGPDEDGKFLIYHNV